MRYHFITEMPCILSIRFLAGECQRKQTLLRKKTPSYKEGVRKIVYIAIRAPFPAATGLLSVAVTIFDGLSRQAIMLADRITRCFFSMVQLS